MSLRLEQAEDFCRYRMRERKIVIGLLYCTCPRNTDLTKRVKDAANGPVYVFEYRLGSYCASNDDPVIKDGLKTAKGILAENYVRANEAEKVKYMNRECGPMKTIERNETL